MLNLKRLWKLPIYLIIHKNKYYVTWKLQEKI